MPTKILRSALLATLSCTPLAGAVDLPAEIADWTLSQDVQSFTAGDLWRYIDGAAEQYLEFGCLRAFVAYYSPASVAAEGIGSSSSSASREIAIELYRMDSALGAFGLYAQEKPQSAPGEPFGAEGYRTPGRLNFYADSIYIKMRCEPGADSTANNGLLAAASAIVKQRALGNTPPEQLALLPPDGVVPGSAGFVPRTILGLAGIDRAVKASYSAEDPRQTATLYILTAAATPELVAQAVESLRKRSVEPPVISTDQEIQLVLGNLKYYGPVLIGVLGQRLVLVSGSVDAPWTRELLDRTLYR